MKRQLLLATLLAMFAGFAGDLSAVKYGNKGKNKETSAVTREKGSKRQKRERGCKKGEKCGSKRTKKDKKTAAK